MVRRPPEELKAELPDVLPKPDTVGTGVVEGRELVQRRIDPAFAEPFFQRVNLGPDLVDRKPVLAHDPRLLAKNRFLVEPQIERFFLRGNLAFLGCSEKAMVERREGSASGESRAKVI
jgi:hypothetical protein